MAVTCIETHGIEKSYGDSDSIRVPFTVTGTESESAAKSALIASAAMVRDGLYRQEYDIRHIGGGVWECTVVYGQQPTKESKESPIENANRDSMQWDIQQNNVTRMMAIAHIEDYGPLSMESADIPTFNGAIEWDGERINGVQVGTGAFQFQITRPYTDDEMTDDFVRLISTRSFMVNSDALWMWDAGEVLFMGASGSRNTGGAPNEVGDDDDVLSGWENITGITSSNSDGGKLYVSYAYAAGYWTVKMYKSSSMTSGNLVAQVLLGSDGVNTVDGYGGSGIGGTITIDQDNYAGDSSSIVVTWPFGWNVTYRFAVSPNSTTETDPGAIVITLGDDAETQFIPKKGWEHIWFEFPKTSNGKYVESKPKFAHVEQIYPTCAFADFNLGDSPFVLTGSGI